MKRIETRFAFCLIYAHAGELLTFSNALNAVEREQRLAPCTYVLTGYPERIVYILRSDKLLTAMYIYFNIWVFEGFSSRRNLV